MRRLLILFACVLLIIPAFGQGDTLRQFDSAAYARMRWVNDSLEKIRMSEQVRAETERGINALVQMQKERNENQKRQAYIRIGLGLLFLVVLVVGLLRRRKK